MAERHSAGVFIVLLFHHTAVRIAFHHLVDELLLDTQAVVGGCVQCALHAVGKHVYGLIPRGIQVALPQDAPIALFEVHRTKRGIHVMQGKQTVLHVHAYTHLLCTPQENAHVSVSDFLKQALAAFSVIVVHNGYLIGGYAGGNQLLFHILVEVEAGHVRVVTEQIHLRPFSRRLVAVAEHELRSLVRRAFLVELDNVPNDLVCLAVGIVRIVRVQ